MWSSLGIRQKVFILFAVIALVPLVIINIIWIKSSRNQLEQAAANRQNIVASGSAQRLNQLLESKIDSIIANSQELSVTNLRVDEAKQHLTGVVNRDNDIARIALVDGDGNELVVIKDNESSKDLKNIKSSEAFKVVTQLSNEVLLGDVAYVDGKPTLTISAPLIAFNRLGEQNLTSAEALARRYGADIKGALIADIDMSDIWGPVLASELGTGGYAYVVDTKGRLIAHRDQNMVAGTPDLSQTDQVSSFIKRSRFHGLPAETQSEKGIKVLSTHFPVERTGWAVIAQEPIESIFEPANQVTQLALLIYGIVGLSSVLLSLFFSRNLTHPIRRLVAGTSQLSQGNFDMQIPIDSNDEIGVLAKRFNAMAGSLKILISNLQTETTKLNVVLDNVGEGIIATDKDNNIVLANISAAVLAGSLPTDLMGKPFESVFPLNKNNHPFQLKLDTSEVYKVYKEAVYVSPSKRLHYLDIYSNRMKDNPNNIKFIITMRDQTDERELEMMKLDFVSMAAHELRTPITAIRGYLSLLSRDSSSTLSDQGKQSIERAKSSTSQLVGLISNLLNVTKIERGTLNMALEKIDWAKTVQEILHDHEFGAEEKQISLKYEGPDEGVFVLADEIAMREVVNNLVANAINYTDPDGNITVSVRGEQSSVVTAVRDDGAGIPPNAIDRLFTKFYRVKGGIASGSGGTGLGLYISRSIVELHKGTIGVESEMGKGSVFTVTLPAFDEIQYKELRNTETKGTIKRRGWITKDTAR